MGSSEGARSIWYDEHLDDMDAPGRGGSSDRIARADIAAHLGVAAGLAHQMRDQRRRRRFAVGAGDGDERRVRRVTPPLAAEQLDVADHFDAGLLREPHRPVRLRMRQRHAGRQHERGELRPVGARADRRSECRRAPASATLSGLSSQAITSAPPAISACAVAMPEPPRPKTRNALAGEGCDGDQRLTAASAWTGRPAPA